MQRTLVAVLVAMLVAVAVDARQFFEYFDIGKKYCYVYEAPEGPHTVTVHYEAFDAWHGSVAFNTLYAGSIYGQGSVSNKREGTHSFMTNREGRYDVCLHYSGDLHGKMYISMTTSIDMDFAPPDDISSDEHVNSFKALRSALEQTIQEAEYISHRAAAFEHTASNTYGRVLLLTFINAAVLIGAGVWQTFHLTKFFKEKKVV